MRYEKLCEWLAFQHIVKLDRLLASTAAAEFARLRTAAASLNWIIESGFRTL